MPRPRLESNPWWPQLLAEKDTHSLRELADRYGVSVNGLSRALRRAGVDRAPVRRGASKAPADKIVSPDPRSIESRDWWPEFLAKKDKQSLAVLAEHFGVAEITLQRAMKRTGVSRKSQRGAKGNRQARAASRKLSAHKHLLGRVSDSEIAETVGVSRYAVAQYRKKHAIASVRGGGKEVTPTQAKRPVVPGVGREAFLVRIAGADERYIVIAADLAQAAARAQSAVTARFSGKGRIEGLEYVGPAL